MKNEEWKQHRRIVNRACIVIEWIEIYYPRGSSTILFEDRLCSIGPQTWEMWRKWERIYKLAKDECRSSSAKRMDGVETRSSESYPLV